MKLFSFREFFFIFFFFRMIKNCFLFFCMSKTVGFNTWDWLDWLSDSAHSVYCFFLWPHFAPFPPGLHEKDRKYCELCYSFFVQRLRATAPTSSSVAAASASSWAKSATNSEIVPTGATNPSKSAVSRRRGHSSPPPPKRTPFAFLWFFSFLILHFEIWIPPNVQRFSFISTQ